MEASAASLCVFTANTVRRVVCPKIRGVAHETLVFLTLG